MAWVVDASALVELFLRSPAAAVVREAVASGEAVAPELLDAEVLYTLARLERSGRMTADVAGRALWQLVRVPIARVPHRDLLDGAWRRRANLSTYDALSVALAARLGCPLITADARLAASPGLGIPVTLVPVHP